jgi:hypothetical protein
MLAIVKACKHWCHFLESSKYLVLVLTDHYNFQGFMKNKPLQGRLCCWWETFSGYGLAIIYWTGKTNTADGLSGRPDYKAVADAEDRRKQAKGQAGESQKGTHSSAAELDEGHKEVARISTAKLLGPWEQQLVPTVSHRLPVASHGSLCKVHRLFKTVFRQEEKQEASRVDLLPSMLEVIKGRLGQNEAVQHFCAVYNLPKNEQQELANQNGRKAYYAGD